MGPYFCEFTTLNIFTRLYFFDLLSLFPNSYINYKQGFYFRVTGLMGIYVKIKTLQIKRVLQYSNDVAVHYSRCDISFAVFQE